MNTSIKYLATAALAAFIASPAMAGGYSTVNSSINLAENTQTGDVDSVNGSIRIGAGSAVGSVGSVNGSIKLDDEVTVDGDIEAVNGAITLRPGCDVGGRVKTVNGGIRMESTRVAGDVETVNGGLQILAGSELQGNVMVRKPGGWSFNKRRKPIRVEIGRDVVVHGDLVFKQPVELRLHESARVGEIIGDEVTMKPMESE